MKKFTLSIVVVFMATALWATSGFEVNYSRPANQIMQLDFNIQNYSIGQIQVDGIMYSKITFEGNVNTQKKGYAQLPYVNATVKLPANKNVSIKVIEGAYTDYQLDQPLLPSRGVIYRDQNPAEIPFEIDPKSLTDTWYPNKIASNTAPFIMKDIRGTSVYVYPFRYNAVQNTLRVYSEISVQLIENNSSPINPLAQEPQEVLREMDGIYSSLFINYQETKDDLTIGQYGDILVVCTSRDETAIQPYIDWKMEKGYQVEMETVATATNVKTLIQNAYDANNNLLYVQLVGDWADIKSDQSSGAPMDPQLGCVVGSDDVADITIGRISANSAAQVTLQVDKIIAYEKYPDLSGSWYKGSLGIGSDQGAGSGDDGEVDKDHIQNIWDNKLDPFTFDDYFTAYDPGANTSQISTAINTGVSLVNYCGHGSPTSWGTTGFSNNNVATLSNGSMLPWLISVACNNGNFQDPTDCFAEAWVKKENGGAIMFLGATISQPWQPPMRGQDYFNDILIGGYDYSLYPGQNGITTNEQRSTLGAIIFNGLALMVAESGTSSDWETAKTWTIFGDPSLQPRTAVPGTLTLSNNVVLVGLDYSTMITGPDGPVEGAMVCISQNGEYYRAVSDASGMVSIPHSLTPGTAHLVITAFNTETLIDEITVVPPGGAYVIVNNCGVDDANGNNNGQADYGETVMLNVSAENVGSDDASGVNAELTSSDPYITIINSSYAYGTVAAGAIVEGPDAFEIQIANDAPDNYPATFEVSFTDNSDATWVSNMTVTLHASNLVLGTYTIDDSNGNNNGSIDPGETVTLTIAIDNEGSSDAYLVMGDLSCIDPYVSVETGTQSFGTIASGLIVEQSFSVTAQGNTPAGHMANFDLNLTGDFELTAAFDFTEVVGHIPVLIIDLDGNSNSANAMQTAISNNGLVAELTTAIPEDLSLYSSVFLCLGIYSDNHVLSSDEGQKLADYLNEGGRLYMEGGDTWAFDDQTAVHPMFNISPQGDGSGDMGTLLGQQGTFTEDMDFTYSGDNSYMDHLSAISPAYVIFENQSPSYGTAVAYDEGTYKTIGCSHEFGGLDDGAVTKDELMAAYLEFFGFTNTLTALFASNETEICENDVVEFYDLSSGNPTGWQWEFEGGSPSSSSMQNPQVMYATAGTYDVTLTVTDGTDTVSITMNDYVSVSVCTGVNESNSTSISVHPNPNNGIFTVDFNTVPEHRGVIKVLNTLGNEVYRLENTDMNGNASQTIDISHLNKGMYFLVFENYLGNTVQRIIIR